jgi:hypothetical protein
MLGKKAKRERLGSVAVRRAFSITEMMNLSEREVRKRAGAARGSTSMSPSLPYQETDRLGPDDLKRWQKPEKPVEILG